MGISTHILDTSKGKPALHVGIELERMEQASWVAVATGATDSDGRCRLVSDEALQEGVYRVSFDTGGYYEAADEQTFYPVVRIVFEVGDANQHYHVPLLLNPFGYSTYRGS